MESTALLLWGVVFSSIGLGFFIYGKKAAALDSFALRLGIADFSLFCCFGSTADCYGQCVDGAALFCQDLAVPLFRTRNRFLPAGEGLP